MSKNIRSKGGLAVVAAAAICGGAWGATSVLASDHDEAPLVKLDPAQDITDLYVFDSGGGTTTIIVCWAGFNDTEPDPQEGTYADNALYTIWVDNNDDEEADHAIYWRYGRNMAGDVGVQWEGVPGAADFVSGPVETVFAVGDGARAWSGFADDPFFFDAQGYLETLDMGAPVFDSTRDFLEGLNVTAAAIEINTALLQDGDSPMQFWVTASRLE